jgi:hypothetical protein
LYSATGQARPVRLSAAHARTNDGAVGEAVSPVAGTQEDLGAETTSLAGSDHALLSRLYRGIIDSESPSERVGRFGAEGVNRRPCFLRWNGMADYASLQSTPRTAA